MFHGILLRSRDTAWPTKMVGGTRLRSHLFIIHHWAFENTVPFREAPCFHIPPFSDIPIGITKHSLWKPAIFFQSVNLYGAAFWAQKIAALEFRSSFSKSKWPWGGIPKKVNMKVSENGSSPSHHPFSFSIVNHPYWGPMTMETSTRTHLISCRAPPARCSLHAAPRGGSHGVQGQRLAVARLRSMEALLAQRRSVAKSSKMWDPPVTSWC